MVSMSEVQLYTILGIGVLVILYALYTVYNLGDFISEAIGKAD